MCWCQPEVRTPNCGSVACNDMAAHAEKMHAIQSGGPFQSVPSPVPAAVLLQPTPKGTGPAIADLVITDILARKEFGTAKYGEPLKAFNGRNPLIDAYQEALDQVQYLRQAIEEKHAPVNSELREKIWALAKDVERDETSRFVDIIDLLRQPSPPDPAMDAGWVVRRCEEALQRGVPEGSAAWAEGLRLIKSQATACVMTAARMNRQIPTT